MWAMMNKTSRTPETAMVILRPMLERHGFQGAEARFAGFAAARDCRSVDTGPR